MIERPALASADVSDLVGGTIAMDGRIRAMWRGARVVGPAFTVWTPPGQHPAVKRALEQAAPGDVIVIDGGAFLGRALWGDKMSLRARELGIAGVVIDGAVRDVALVEKLAFPLFAIASAPTAPHGEVDGELGVTIACGERRVEPGDLIVGDDDGVVVVPRAAADEVLRRIAEGERMTSA